MAVLSALFLCLLLLVASSGVTRGESGDGKSPVKNDGGDGSDTLIVTEGATDSVAAVSTDQPDPPLATNDTDPPANTDTTDTTPTVSER